MSLQNASSARLKESLGAIAVALGLLALFMITLPLVVRGNGEVLGVEPAKAPLHLPAMNDSGPGLTVVKELTDPPAGIAIVGETITFTIRITNSGTTTITSLSLIDTYAPDYLSLTSSSVPTDAHDSATGVITWTDSLTSFLPLAPNKGFSLTLDFQAGAPTASVTNTARAEGQDENGDPVGPEQGSDAVTIKGRIHLPVMLKAYTSPVSSWHQGIGTAGLTVYSLAVCPADPNVIYAGTKEKGVYSSTSGGVWWQPTTLTGEMVWDIAVQPDDCQVVYATTWGRWVQKTENGGTSWSEMSTGLGEEYLLGLAIDPDDVQIVYAGTYGQGVYKSTNGGGQWVFAGLSGLEVTELVIDPSPPKTIHAGTWGNGVYRSTDNGGSWLPAESGPADVDIYALAVDPTNHQVVYAATYTQGIYRSEDRGVNWAQDGLLGQVAYTVVVDENGIAYAGTDGTSDGQGVHKRPVSGLWEPMTKQPGAPLIRSLNFRNFILLAGTTGGVWWYGLD